MQPQDADQQTPHPQRRGRLAAVAGVIAVAGIGGGLLATQGGGSKPTAAGASAASGPKTITDAQAFYRNKTINLVSPDKPGGGFDEWARLVAPVLATELHAHVNVNNIPAGNTVAGQNAVAKSPPDGLTIGWLNAGPDVENSVLGLGALAFDPAKQVFLGATAPGQTAVLDLNNASCAKWNSFAKVVANSTAAAPVSEVLQTAGTGTFLMVMANTAFGIHAHAVTGYASTSDQVQGFVRGDGCLTEMPASVAASLVKSKVATAILLSEPLQPSASIVKDFVGVPTVAEEAKQLASTIRTTAQRNALTALNEVDTSTRVFFAPQGTPVGEVALLQQAFKAAMNNPQLQARAIAEGNPVGYESPALAKQQYLDFLAAAKKEVPVLRSIIG